MPISISVLPTLTVLTAATSGSITRATARVVGELSIAAGYGFLILAERDVVSGEFVPALAGVGVYIFETDHEIQGPKIQTGVSYAYIDRSWGERGDWVWLVNRNWQRDVFSPRDSVRYVLNEAGAVEYTEEVVGGWDHEHCGICDATISQKADPVGYRDDYDRWICARCYVQKIVNDTEHVLMPR